MAGACALVCSPSPDPLGRKRRARRRFLQRTHTLAAAAGLAVLWAAPEAWAIGPTPCADFSGVTVNVDRLRVFGTVSPGDVLTFTNTATSNGGVSIALTAASPFNFVIGQGQTKSGTAIASGNVNLTLTATGLAGSASDIGFSCVSPASSG